ncbi:890_t:CDS:2 [Scutellospora calospora]|uniref:890_t:CDS:1 n=1 Tax=Scutellospora calospora TaxID=85575 RepID=A0ACA9LX82_9GLOM|nr:890_t:CDS:2 [Scutellospora calospora]
MFGFKIGVLNYRLDEIPYGDFERKTRIGRGGFGTVYKTESKSLGYVAIKEVESETDEKVKKLFINEVYLSTTYARLLSRLMLKILTGLVDNLGKIIIKNWGF